MNPKFWFGVYSIGPDSSGTGGNISGPVGHMDASDDLKFLRQDDGETKDKDKDKSEEETEEDKVGDKEDKESDDEEEEEEEQTEEENREQEEDDTEEEEDDETDEEEVPGGLVSAKDLKAKFPDIFKKVPELKAVIYREQQYSQLFADPKEAQEASVLAETFREMESDLVSGDSEALINGLKNTKDADFDKFASNFLPNLRKIDEAAFMKVIAVPFKQMLRAALAKGLSRKDKNLEYAAQHIHQFIFDDVDINGKTDFEQPEIKVGPEEEKFKKKVQELDQRDHDNFKTSVDNTWGEGVRDYFLSGFDQKNLPTKWVLDKMVEDCIRLTNKQLIADPRHMKNMEGLWRQAKAAGYNSESKTRIVNAALARAKQIIPQIRTTLRSEAFAKGKARVENGEKKTFKPNGSTENRSNENRNSETRRTSRPNPKSTESMSELDVIRS